MKLARLSLAVTLFLTFGCAGSGATDSSTGSGTSGDSAAAGKLSVVLTDAPAAQLRMARRATAPVDSADVRSAVVTIARISLVGEGAPVVLRDTPVQTDLLTLAQDVKTLVDGATIPPGTYTQLRFVITGGYLDVGGTIYASSKKYEGVPADRTVGGTLQMPSYAQSGLKVLLPGGGLVVDANTQTLQVDFDVSESFGHGAGNSGKWVMHPVIKATNATTPSEPVATGTVAVALVSEVEGGLPEGITLDQFQATLTPVAGGEATKVTLLADGEGPFTATFSSAPAGDYLLSFEAPATLVGTPAYDPVVPAPVTVTAGETVNTFFFLYAIVPPAP